MKIAIKIGTIRFAVIVMFMLGIWTSSCNAANKNLDVILLMDSSGSMKYTDPNKLRASAAKLFVSLLDKNDRASIVSFSDKGYPVAYLTKISKPRSQPLLFSAIDKISTKGVYTNLSGAVETAINVLKRNPNKNHKRIIILMSDGKIDMENSAISEQLTKKLIDQQIPELRKLGITLNTIAFTENSDKTLLKQLANKSGGAFYLANTDKALRGAYTAMFEQSKAPNQIPFTGDAFSIDASVSETTIIGTKSTKLTELTLVSPSGNSYNIISNKKSISWHAADTYDIITIKKPATGKWKLVSSDGDNKAYIVSDLQLYISHDPKIPSIGEGVVIKAWLQSGNKTITKKEIIEGVKINLEAITPDDVKHKLTMEPYSQFSDDASSAGVFASHIAFPSTGQFKITITFESSTFARQKVAFINVDPKSSSNKKPNDVIEESHEVQPQADHTTTTSTTTTTTQHEPMLEAEPNHHDSVESHPAKEAHHDEPASSPDIAPIDHVVASNDIQLPKLPNINGVDSNPAIESSTSHSEESKSPINNDSHDEGYKKYAKDSDTPQAPKEDLTDKGKEHSSDDKKAHTEETGDKNDGAMMAIIAFVGINFLLISGGIGGYFIYKRRKAKAKAAEELDRMDSEDSSEDEDSDTDSSTSFESTDKLESSEENNLSVEFDADKQKVA